VPPDAFPRRARLRGVTRVPFLRETFSQLTISNGRVSRGARTRTSFRAFLSHSSLFLSHPPLPLPPPQRGEMKFHVNFQSETMAFEIARCRWNGYEIPLARVTYKNTMSLRRETHLALPRSKPNARERASARARERVSALSLAMERDITSRRAHVLRKRSRLFLFPLSGNTFNLIFRLIALKPGKRAPIRIEM